jgi:hypothetical protein
MVVVVPSDAVVAVPGCVVVVCSTDVAVDSDVVVDSTTDVVVDSVELGVSLVGGVSFSWS